MNRILFLLILYACIDCIYFKHNIYQLFIDGVKEALKLFITIFPSLFALTFFVSLIQSSHIFSFAVKTHFPQEIYLMGLMRPISSQSTMVMLNNIYQTFGVDHPYAILASIIQSGSDTTCYVVSLYYANLKISSKQSLCIGIVLDCVAFLFAMIVFCYFLV